MSERRTGYFRRILGLWIAVILCLIIAIFPILAPPAPSGDEPDAISVDGALEHVKFIAQEPHVMGTPEIDRVREYLIASLVEEGFDPETLTIEAPDYFRESGGMVDVTDVFVRIPGSSDDRAILFMARDRRWCRGCDDCAKSKVCGADGRCRDGLSHDLRRTRTCGRHLLPIRITSAREPRIRDASGDHRALASCLSHRWAGRYVRVGTGGADLGRQTDAGGDGYRTRILNSPGATPYSSENDREKWLRLAKPDSLAMEPTDLRDVRNISAEWRNRTCRTKAIGVSLKHSLNRSEKAERLIIAVDAID